VSTKLTIDLPEDMRQWVNGVAATRGESVSVVIQEALQSYRAEAMSTNYMKYNHVDVEDASSRRQASQQAFERERAAYEKLAESLRPQYEGLYVAIRGGHVVDSDADELALIARVYDRFGYGPLYVRKVGSPLPTLRIPSPRLVS
jgi:hypothetical protein